MLLCSEPLLLSVTIEPMNISHTFLPMVALLSFVAFTSGCSRKSEFGPPLENIYRVPIKGKFVSLDPHNVSDAYSAQVQSLTYESLYQNHFLKRPYVLIPALAEKMPEGDGGAMPRVSWTMPSPVFSGALVAAPGVRPLPLAF